MEMPISQILLLFAVFLVGLIILAIGLVRKKRTVEVVGISLLIAVLIAFFVESQEVRDILVSFAIVSVAILSALSIAETRRLRQGSIDRESRDRKERLLNEIIEWAENICKSSLESIDPNAIIFDTPIEQMATQRGFYNLRLRYQAISVKSEYMEGIAKKVFGNELLSATEIVTQKLGEIIDVLKDCLTNRRASQEGKSEKVETYKKSLDSCAEDLIKEAAKIKTREIS